MPRLRPRSSSLPVSNNDFSTGVKKAETFLQRQHFTRWSSLRKSIDIELQQAGLRSLTTPNGNADAKVDLLKIKRKKCGTCPPCLRKENCGRCGNCLNRKRCKQICTVRKCEELKKMQSERKLSKVGKVEHLEDDGRGEAAAEVVHKVPSVDGPRSGGQMEIGSHDRLQEGVLGLELANGVSPYLDDDEESMETEQQKAGSVHPRQSWVPGHGKISDTQQQQTCWSGSGGATAAQPVHHADMEDAHNLVAFSVTASSLPPSSSPCQQVQINTTHLYERFIQETGAGGAHSRGFAEAPEGSCQPSEDLETLRTALSQAKRGHKPPNCNCDGPDCPDYLEWLEKKIKLATRENQGSHNTADGAPHSQQTSLQQHPQTYRQMNGTHHKSNSCSQQQAVKPGPHQDQVPCSKPPIPCSPQVLSMVKEKNISLQAAIAIDALTQLSGSGPQAASSLDQTLFKNTFHNKQHTENITHGLSRSSPTHTSSSRTQSVPPGLQTNQQDPSCEHHRPQSQGHLPHATPFPSSTSPFPGQGKPLCFSYNPPQGKQGSGRELEQMNPWMCLKSVAQSLTAHNKSNPMSELKQLLGDTSGKLKHAPFKLPVMQQLSLKQNGEIQGQGGSAQARTKQESDPENHHHTASVGQYGISNGKKQGQHYFGNTLSPGQASISHSTQAALQHHLHYRRNLFSTHPSGFGAPGSRAPMSIQNLKKWWPQVDAEGLSLLQIKQEPKKKKSSPGSPVMKSIGGMSLGHPLSKPKQIIIKKTKQKASLPTFLPQAQISAQKPPVHVMDRSPALNSVQACSLPSLALLNSTQAAVAGLPAQSQVSISNTSMTSSSTPSVASEHAPTLVKPAFQSVAPAAHDTSEDSGMSLTSSNTSNVTPVTSTSSSNTSQLQNLINIDPKFEELIRQFEAEFEDSVPDTSASQSKKEIAPGPKLGNQCVISPQDLSSTSSQTTKSVPTAEANATPHSDDQEMVVNKNGLGSQSETTTSLPNTQSTVEMQRQEPADAFVNQETSLDKQQPPRVLENTFSMQGSPLPKRFKFEASGELAVLSTTCFSEEDTPSKDGLHSSPSLKGFLDSPLRYLDTPTKNLLDTPFKDQQSDLPTCTCVEQVLEKDEGPYYNHLGSGPTVASVRTLMETRYGEKGEAVRIEKVVYTGREGKSSHGCPIAKWVIRRSSEKEKLLCLVRHRAGHHCANAVIIVVILAWEGIPRVMADKLYRDVTDTLTQYGNPTSRRCGLNDDRTCACQGKEPEMSGASFSFGCSWSMYFNGCKYARSKTPRKFRLQGDHPEDEEKLRDNFQNLATEVAPLYKQLAPQAYSNQCQAEHRAPDCRLGLKEGRPFSGITACMDFCAHAHKDQHNLHNGCTVVCTLTKEDNRKVGEIPDDEQLHVLPLYKMSQTDEFGSEAGQRIKMKTGAIQVLQAFRREVRKLPEPAKSCRQRRLEAKKAASEKKKNKLLQQPGETPEKTVVKSERCISSSPQLHANKEMIKQDVKPNVKMEPFSGSIDGHPMQATDAFKNIYQHPAYYARGAHSPAGQPSPADAVNGYHHSLPTMPYSYYNYPPNALFPRKLRTYEGRNGSLPKPEAKPVQIDEKPDFQNLQARQSQSSINLPEQLTQSNTSAYTQPSDYNASRPSSVSSESSNRGTPLIKQEPMDVPVYEGALPSQTGANTSRTTPQTAAWTGYKSNGSVNPTTWDGHLNRRQSPDVSSLNLDKQQFHQHSQQRQSSAYPQQWTSFPCSNPTIASPNPSLQLHSSPPLSPLIGTALQANLYQGSACHVPSHPGTPQPGTSHSGSVTPHSVTPGPGTPHSVTPRSLTPGTPGPVTPRHWVSPASSPQPNAWGMSPAAYSPGLKHSNPAGACPDKMWSKTRENRCSTPLGLQEKAWKSCGGSVAGSTPSPAPEGRLFPDALQQSNQAYCDPCRAESVDSSKHEEEGEEEWSDSEHNFLDPTIGGVAVAPTHGSILIECARRELHATTPLKKPDRSHPTRISLVFYQHKNLNQPLHGLALWESKMKLLAERALQRQQEAALLGLSQEDIKTLGKKRKWGATVTGSSPGPGQSKDKKVGPVTRLSSTFNTTSLVTVSPYAFTRLTGPYSHFV